MLFLIMESNVSWLMTSELPRLPPNCPLLSLLSAIALLDAKFHLFAFHQSCGVLGDEYFLSLQTSEVLFWIQM